MTAIKVSETADNAKEEEDEEEYVDGGWGWVIVACSFMITVMSTGLENSTGVFYVIIMAKFHRSSSDVAWIMSLNAFFVCFIGPIGSVLLASLGGRVTIIIGSLLIALGMVLSAFAPVFELLYLSLGIITGAGIGIAYQAALITVNFYFLKRRGVANGIVVCGSGLGIFVFPLLIRILVENFGFHGAFLLLAGVALQGVVCGSLVISPKVALEMSKAARLKKKTDDCKFDDLDKITDDITPEVISPEERHFQSHQHSLPSNSFSSSSVDKNVEQIVGDRKNINNNVPVWLFNRLIAILKESYDKVLVKDGMFVIFALSQFLFKYAVPTVYTFYPDRGLSFSLTQYQSSFIISVVGISSICGRIFCGLLADTKFFLSRRLYMLAVSLLIGGAGIVVNFGPTFAHQLVSAALFGVCVGTWFCLQCITIADLLGTAKLAKAYGMINFLASFGALIGPTVSGWIFDLTARYDIIFASSGLCLLVSGGILFVIPCIRLFRRKKHRQHQNQQTRKPETNAAFNIEMSDTGGGNDCSGGGGSSGSNCGGGNA